MCHPVLPLLLTTSHHNIDNTVPTTTSVDDEEDEDHEDDATATNKRHHNNSGGGGDRPLTGFVSELIFWSVEPVGPLSKSGGLVELARVHSLVPSAFAAVAWLPTLLPR